MLLVIDCKYAIIEKMPENGKQSKHAHTSEEMEDLIDGLSTKDPDDKIKKDPGSELSYGDVGYHALGNFGRLLVECAIILSQTGFCCAYLLFISTNLTDFFPKVPKNYWLIGLLPLEFSLCLFRNLKKLALTSLFAQISNLLAFGVVFWFDFEEFHKVKHHIHPKEFSIVGLPFFLCVAIYCYEGAGMILSLEASLHRDIRYQFRRYFLSVITMVTVLYATFGACGYLSFGAQTKDIITLNLSESGDGNVFTMFVTSCLCLSLFFTYPIMMFPVTSIIDSKMGISADRPQRLKANALRLILVILTGMIVLIIPDFGNLMAFIGATCCIWLAFILPAVFHMKICARSMTAAETAIDYVIIGMGIAGTIVGMIDAIRRMSGELETTTKNIDVVTSPPCSGGTCSTPSLDSLQSTVSLAVKNITKLAVVAATKAGT
ncbi:hypothetical protein EB796_019061 [Bugula neritina]|uniref:Amino acid transporter transmembrane domain-containing protein n=1 Tax=Bugula neritina TaxID=10212 RepID=A0A7J7J9B2_BUGNE|nr:hypothetical protein EB796_019061 [Bugula neritina]